MHNLVALAIDEVHVVWGYRQFRSEYGNIGDLRAHIRTVPVVGLSATLTPIVLLYLHKALLLASPTILYRLPVGRSNVALVVASMATSGHALGGISFIIDPSKRVAFLIPKTFIFVDEVDLAVDIARYLHTLLHKDLQESAREVVKVMTASLDPSTRDSYMNGLRDGYHRVIVGTEVVAMGLNFPDVEVIVQWGIAGHLTLASVWQRIGRAARNPALRTLAVVFVPECFILPEENDLAIHHEGWYYGWWQAVDPSRKHLVDKFTAQLYGYGSTKPIRGPYDRIDPALLFLLNTTGCRWRGGLACFDDRSWVNRTGLAEMPTNQTPSYCCDNCYFTSMHACGNKFPEPAFIIHGFNLKRSLSYRFSPACAQDSFTTLLEINMGASERIAKPLSTEQLTIARTLFVNWRSQQMQSWVRTTFPGLMTCDFLRDSYIEKLCSAVHSIQNVNDLAATLAPDINLDNSVLYRAIDSLLDCVRASQAQIGPQQFPRAYNTNLEARAIKAHKKTTKQLADKAVSAFNIKAKHLNLSLKDPRALDASDEQENSGDTDDIPYIQRKSFAASGALVQSDRTLRSSSRAASEAPDPVPHAPAILPPTLTNVADPAATPQHTPPIKKKRGRPSKADKALAAQTMPPPLPPQAKKKRGRPSKADKALAAERATTQADRSND